MIVRISWLTRGGHPTSRDVCRVLFLFAFVFVHNGAAMALDGAHLFEMNKAAVVKLEITGRLSNQHRSQPRAGSGFIIYSGKPHTVILTAAHVIGPTSEWDQEGGMAIRTVRVEVLDDHGKLIELTPNARVHEQNDAQDWAILIVDGEGYSCLEQGDPVSVPPGTVGTLIGYEADSKVPGHVEGKVSKTEVEHFGFVLRLNMDVIEGQSGGPILDTHGRVLGIASSNDRDRHGFHIGVPVSLPGTALQPLLPSDGGGCISAERQYDGYLKTANEYKKLDKQKEYVEALETLLKNDALLQRLPYVRRLQAEVYLHREIGLTLMSKDFIEGISAPKHNAIAHLEKARLLDPNNVSVLIVLGFGRAAEGTDRLADSKSKASEIKNLYAEAFKSLDDLRFKRPLSDDDYYLILSVCHYWYGRALNQLKEYAAAEKELKAGLSIAEQHKDLPGTAAQINNFLYRLGQNEFNRSHDVASASRYWRDLSEGTEFLNNALTLTGLGQWKDGMEARLRGNEENAKQKFLAAEQYLSLAKQGGYRSWGLSFTLGVLYFYRENFVDAAANFQDATSIDPSRYIAFSYLGQSKLMIKDGAALEEARIAMKRAIELKPDDSESQYWYGEALAAMTQNTAALDAFKRSIQIDGRNTKAHVALIKSLVLAANNEGADRRNQTILYENALRNAKIGMEMAILEKNTVAIDRIKHLEQLMLGQLAYLYAEQGEYLPLAEKYIDDALNSNPDDPTFLNAKVYYLDTKAWILIRQSELDNSLSSKQRDKRLRSAEQLLKKGVLDSMPKDDANARAEAIFHLGYIDKLRGNSEEAQRRFMEALDLNPEYKNAKEALK